MTKCKVTSLDRNGKINLDRNVSQNELNHSMQVRQLLAVSKKDRLDFGTNYTLYSKFCKLLMSKSKHNTVLDLARPLSSKERKTLELNPSEYSLNNTISEISCEFLKERRMGPGGFITIKISHYTSRGSFPSEICHINFLLDYIL